VLTEFPKVEQGSDQWHDLRRGIVTASVVGKLLTPTLKVADNDTSRALTATLVAERITGWTEDTPMTSDMLRGVDSEPIARDIYSGHYQQAVETGFMRYDGDGWTLGYSPDGLVSDDGLIEIKAPRAKTHLNTILADRVPPYYMAQLQAGLLVSGRDWIDFVSYCGGMPLYVKRVQPDPLWHEAITYACQVFEDDAADMVRRYETATTGLPATERIDFNRVELKLA
jgi:putative phage-type endonuclease